MFSLSLPHSSLLFHSRPCHHTGPYLEGSHQERQSRLSCAKEVWTLLSDRWWAWASCCWLLTLGKFGSSKPTYLLEGLPADFNIGQLRITLSLGDVDRDNENFCITSHFSENLTGYFLYQVIFSRFTFILTLQRPMPFSQHYVIHQQHRHVLD